MRILIDDGMQIERRTGIGNYTRFLLEAMRSTDGIDVALVSHDRSDGRIAARLGYLLEINSKEYYDFAADYDAVIFTNYAIPIRAQKGVVIDCIHDLAAFSYPETLPRFYSVYNRAIVKHAVKNADGIVTVSKTVMDEICDMFPSASGKVSFAWPGRFGNISVSDDLSEFDDKRLEGVAKHPYFLFVSTVEKRKNVEYVIEAFREFKLATQGDVFLVIAGRPGFGYDDIQKVAVSSGFCDSIIFPGFVSDNDLNLLYRSASALVFPTLYEGFGVSQVECMVYGIPSLVSDIPVNHEVSRDYAAYFDLGDPSSLAREMMVVAEKKGQDEKRDIALRYLEDFDWSRVVECYLEAIRKAQSHRC